MTSEIKDILENMTTAAPEMEDYIGEDGLLYCGKCHTPKEAYFPEGKELFGRDRHPAECDCQRAAREQRQAAEEHRRHVEAVENLKQRAFADSAMQQWTFENDNGRNPQTGIARRYAEHWEEMQAENIGCLFWGNVGNGKSYLAGCIANALMEKEVPVYMTNFAVILGDLSPGFTGRNEYISRLCRYPLLIIDDFGMERGTDYGLEQVFHVIDTRYRSGFRFQYPRHLVGGGAGGVFLEKAGHDKNGIPHADFRHAVAAAGGTAQRSGTATTSTAGLSGSAIPSSKTRPAARRRT